MRNNTKDNPYEELITIPYPIPSHHPKMSLEKRAAQFAPFAALTGYEKMISESERITEKKKDLSPEKISEINQTLALIRENIKNHPSILITYFIPDPNKDGGEYRRIYGKVMKLTDTELIMESKICIPYTNIVEMEKEK